MNSATTNLIVGFLQDLLVTGGSIIVAEMVATGTVKMPSLPVVLMAVLMGGIAAGRRAQSKVDPSVVQRAVRTPEVKLRTPAQLEAEGRAKEEAAHRVLELAAETERVTEVVRRVLAEARPGVTPLRVAPPAEPAAPSPFATP